MTQTVSVPLWLLLLILVFAGVTFASHFLFPSVRWFFRRRMEKAVARLNQRLTRPIQPFKLARRYDMIQRLVYDPEVTAAVFEEARSEGIPENVAFERATRYAREIVPSFSATMYFTIGARLSAWLTKLLYHVRIGAFDRDKIEKIHPDASVVFVMNHRSNMDYVLITYLTSTAGTVSYAVGEWARIWPLSGLIRMMGAYFIRRKSLGPLYRKVLSRYVKFAVEGGETQAIFPEGGLSLDGTIGAPKLGLLSYIITAAKESGREVIFVPVSLNYDRVLEDRVLIDARLSGKRRFRAPIWKVLWGVGAHLVQMLTFRFKGFGTAAVEFGEPTSLWSIKDDTPEAVAELLMARISANTPLVPVPLVARALLGGQRDRLALVRDVESMVTMLVEKGAKAPSRTAAKMVTDALELLAERGLVTEDGQKLVVAPEAEKILSFYSASISHYFNALAA
ncbi:1-acyl-sn-glycerol-3-phosphate acyltransferase [Marivivens sp. LCG002]|nr:1-acyl-sn-glycerol-3-phosphate acyltransferase [Marivivens sp. LCG002]WIV50213.1 1-acyl-sn-glycerol-3-phosphate acyltransferase [Marivivens sp. LCG002]